jgi:hypothetical protein
VVRQPQQLRRRRLHRPAGAAADRGDTYTYSYCNCYSDTNRHSYSHRNCDRNFNSNSNSNTNSYGNSNTNSYGYGNSYSYSYGQADTHAEVCAKSEASSHTAAETVVSLEQFCRGKLTASPTAGF